MASSGGKHDETVVRLVDDVLAKAVARQASDLHFEPEAAGLRVRLRLDGLLHDADRIPPGLADNVIARLKVLAGLLTYRPDVPQEGSFQYRGADGQPRMDIRVATFPTVRGERATVRLLYNLGKVSGLDNLGLAQETIGLLRRAARQPHGLILVTGPAGSGKSTTLYALAREVLTATPGRSVVSLEDPVEQRVEGMAQIQVNPYGELTYVRAMRSLLRQDVQVLLVGEIRDAETAHIVVEASLTGHLLMSTLHSGDPAEAVVRLLEMGIAPYQVAGALTVVLAQRLLRVVCPACGGGPQSRCCSIGGPGRGAECEVCAGTGYRGRTACGQVVVIDGGLREAVLARRPTTELRRLTHERGPDLAADAERLVRAEVTTRDEVLRVLGSV